MSPLHKWATSKFEHAVSVQYIQMKAEFITKFPRNFIFINKQSHERRRIAWSERNTIQPADVTWSRKLRNIYQGFKMSSFIMLQLLFTNVREYQRLSGMKRSNYNGLHHSGQISTNWAKITGQLDIIFRSEMNNKFTNRQLWLHDRLSKVYWNLLLNMDASSKFWCY